MRNTFSRLFYNKYLLGFSILALLHSCKISYQCFRPEQRVKHADTDMVTRVYIDRYGDFYPDTAIRINPKRFHTNGSRSNSTLASLSNYFQADKKRLQQLSGFYGVRMDTARETTYRKVQEKIMERLIAHIVKTASCSGAKRIVYLVHGFNDTIAENEYTILRDTIAHMHYSADKKPVYVDIHWDGLNAHSVDGPKVIKIWKPALLNSLFASMALRNLMTGVERHNKLPSIVISHSLGAGVSFGALFNTEHKWHSVDRFSSKAYKTRAQKIIEAPTPVTPIKIGVLAPAIPAENTFVDFNNRKPAPISADKNNISLVMIAYNYKDYGVSKQIFGINFSPVYYSTTLGCNFTVAGKSAIERVKDEMVPLGYGANSKVVQSIEFQTPLRKNPPIIQQGTREHKFSAYIANDKMKKFLDMLFGD